MEFCLKKKATRKSGVKIMNEETRIMGYCTVCNTDITDDMEDVYVDDYGNYFCNFECVAEHFELHKLEF